MPALSYVFGLKPWDVERLTFAEVETYLSWLRDYLKQQQQG